MNVPFSITRDFYWWKLRRNTMRALRAVTGDPGHILDVGCGHAALAPTSMEVLGEGWFYLGIDLSIAALQGARKHLKECGISGAFAQADSAAALPLPNGSIRVLVCSEVLEHIPKPLKLLREMARVLAEGGLAVFTTPNPRRWLSRNGAGVQDSEPDKDGTYGHVSVLPQSAWRTLFAEAGLEVVEVARGALFFGKREYERSIVVVGAYILADGLLDLMPGAGLTENICYTVRKTGTNSINMETTST